MAVRTSLKLLLPNRSSNDYRASQSTKHYSFYCSLRENLHPFSFLIFSFLRFFVFHLDLEYRSGSQCHPSSLDLKIKLCVPLAFSEVQSITWNYPFSFFKMILVSLLADSPLSLSSILLNSFILFS